MPGQVNTWDKIRTFGTVAGAVLIPVVVALIGSKYSNAIKEQEVGAELVALALDILTEETDAAEPASQGAISDGEASQIEQILLSAKAKIRPPDIGARELPQHLQEALREVDAALAFFVPSQENPSAGGQLNPLSRWAVQVVDEYCDVKLSSVKIDVGENERRSLAYLLERSQLRLPSRRKGP